MTAGIDFAFTIAAELCGADVARRLQLFLEYDPQPPFDISEHNAPPELLRQIRADSAPMLEKRRQSNERTAARRRQTRSSATTA